MAARDRAPRVGFLFNHEQVHQILHSAPIAMELSRHFPDTRVELLYTTPAQRDMLVSVIEKASGQRCTLRELGAIGLAARLTGALQLFAPLRRIAVLRENAALFSEFDAIVVPEKTSLRIRSLPGCERVRLIHTRHGAGDRAIGFDKESREFDLVLLSGDKIRRRLEAAGALAPAHAIVGYPKFDAVAKDRPRFFDNGRPTILYNPHPSPHLSSWFRMGREILDFFRDSSQYNLIVAPHVMLFQHRLQVSIDKLAFARVAPIPREYYACNNIRIDLGSPACIDMTYTRAADLYLGDVSSQVCEFLVDPRPCVFANAHHVRWRDDPSYAAWKLGPVFERIEELPAALAEAFRDHAKLRGAQEAYVRDTFALSEIPSALRAARAIHEYLISPGRANEPARPSGSRA